MEFSNKEEAMEVAKGWWEEYQDQKITVSWLEDGEQKDQVLYDGEDHQLAEFMLNLHRMARFIERENRDEI